MNDRRIIAVLVTTLYGQEELPVDEFRDRLRHHYGAASCTFGILADGQEVQMPDGGPHFRPVFAEKERHDRT